MRLPSPQRRLALTLLALLPTLSFATTTETTQAPRIEAQMLDGTPTSVAAHRGDIVLVSVWSPESLSSRKCIWELQRFAGAYASRGVYTLAVSTLDDKNALREFIAKRKLDDLPVAILGKHDLSRIDDPRLPLVYVFDRNGELKATRAGLYSLHVLEQLVAPLLP